MCRSEHERLRMASASRWPSHNRQSQAKYNCVTAMDLMLPLDYAAIERILPHRYPFLLVDRITEFEVDKRIVGIKNVSLNERYLSHDDDGPPVLPPTILTEAVAQVGAIMILAKPENRAAPDLLHGHRARPLSPAGAPGRRRRDRSARSLRLRSRMGR